MSVINKISLVVRAFQIVVGVGIAAQQVKLSLGTCTSVSECLNPGCSASNPTSCYCILGAAGDGPVIGFLPPMWVTWMQFQALALAWLLEAFWGVNQRMEDLPVSLSSSLLTKWKIKLLSPILTDLNFHCLVRRKAIMKAPCLSFLLVLLHRVVLGVKWVNTGEAPRRVPGT